MAKPSAKKSTNPPKPATAVPPVSFADPAWLYWANRHGSLLYLLTASAMLLILFKNYLFGSWLYLFDDTGSDTLNVFYPSIKHIADYFREEGLPAWSFRQGIGQNIFPNSLSDPFNYPLYLAGGDSMAYWIAWVECLKILLGGWLFTRYLRIMGMDGYVSMLGGLFFAFSGYAIIGSGWYVFTSDLTHVALLLLAFEMYFQRGQWWLFPIAVALLMAFSPVITYVYVVFFAAYFLWRYFTTDRDRSFGDFATTSLVLIGLAALGALLTMALWLPAMKEILDSPRSGVASLSERLKAFPIFGFEGVKHNAMAALRMFGNDLAGSAQKFYGWRNYLESPMNYCGLLSLLLAPQVFVGLSRREKIAYGIMLALFTLPIIFPFFRYLFWLFSGDYYRNFSHLFGLTIQLFALLAFYKLVREQKINIWLLLGTLAGLLGLLFYPWGLGKTFPALQFQAAVFLVLQAVLVVMATRPVGRTLALAALPIVIVAELTLTAWPTLNDRNAVTREQWQNGYYNDDSQKAVQWIQAQDSTFYRITKKDNSGAKIHKSFNDAKVQKFYGNTSYHSFNHPGLINLHVATGVIDTASTRKDTLEGFTRWAQGVKNYVYLQYITTSRYTIQSTPIWKDRFIQTTTDSLTTIGNQKILRHKLTLPFGATYEKYITEDEIQKLEKRYHRQSAMLKACAVRKEDVPKLDGLGEVVADSVPGVTKYTNVMMLKDVESFQKDSFRLEHFSQNHIKGSINLDKKKMLFLSVPIDDGWAVLVDGKPAKPVQANFAFMGFPLEAGEHTVEMTYHIPLLSLGLKVSGAALVVYLLALLAGLFFKMRRQKQVEEA